MRNQKDLLLKLMLVDGHVSKLVADSYRIGNIKGRINELRNYWGQEAILRSWHTDAFGKRYARYSIAPDGREWVRGYLLAKYPDMRDELLRAA